MIPIARFRTVVRVSLLRSDTAGAIVVIEFALISAGYRGTSSTLTTMILTRVHFERYFRRSRRGQEKLLRKVEGSDIRSREYEREGVG